MSIEDCNMWSWSERRPGVINSRGIHDYFLHKMLYGSFSCSQKENFCIFLTSIILIPNLEVKYSF